jgi:UDP-glucose 6-dehydrogenase
MRLGIVGNGIVGRATAKCFAEHELRITDLDPSRSTHDIGEVVNCDLVFVCLPTPKKPYSFECDTSAIDEFFRCRQKFDELEPKYVIRSTVPIGYTKKFVNVVHWPDFHTERFNDAAEPEHLVVGGHHRILMQLLRDRWPDVPLYQLSTDESEAVKLMQNGFSAVKLAFFNDMKLSAMHHGLRWEQILSALLACGFINPHHTQVPGPDEKFGFGGSCLPKDLANLVWCTNSALCAAALKWARFDG